MKLTMINQWVHVPPRQSPSAGWERIVRGMPRGSPGSTGGASTQAASWNPEKLSSRGKPT
jgi:hypothetical protein